MTGSSKKKVRLAALAAVVTMGSTGCAFPVAAGLFGGPGAQYCEWRFFEAPVPGSHGIFPGVPLEIASSHCIYGL